MALPYWPLYCEHALQLILAFIVGGVIGFERQLHGRPAGLRTHILVCLGAALIAMVDTLIPGSQGKVTAQIVSGVGFLGAGAILRDGTAVTGLTTAASVWCSAGMGIAIGSGGLSIWMGLTATALVLLTLTLVETLEKLAIHGQTDRQLAVYISSVGEQAAADAASSVIDAIIRTGAIVKSVTLENLEAGPLTRVIHISLTMSASGTPEAVAKCLVANPNVNRFDWMT